MQLFGLDIGGSGTKGAPVNAVSGALTADRFKVPTPDPAEPDAVAKAVNDVVSHFGWNAPLGITFPGVVTNGVIRTACNMHPAWIGRDGAGLFAQVTGLPVTVLNDGDAAGVAEMKFGAGIAQMGTVMMLTFGTGIGSALFSEGVLVPNTELGHVELHGADAETRASAAVREAGTGMSWAKWTRRVEAYLQHVEMLFSPDLFIIGGGVSRKADKFVPMIEGVRAPIVPAELCNDAGIVGAAMAAMSLAA